MKNLIVAFCLISPIAFSSVLNIQPRLLPTQNKKILGMAQGLTQKFEQSQRGSAPISEADPEEVAFLNYTIEMLKHPLFMPISLTICGLKMASPLARQNSNLDPTKIADVAQFNSSFTILASVSVASIQGVEQLSDREMAHLINEAYRELIMAATEGCISGFSKESALKAQREGIVSTFMSDFTSEIIDRSNRIIADMEKADPKANETYEKEVERILTDLVNKQKEQQQKANPGAKNVKGVRAL